MDDKTYPEDVVAHRANTQTMELIEEYLGERDRAGLAVSPPLDPTAFPLTAQRYTEEQIHLPQMALVVNLLVRRDPRHTEVLPNKLFRKEIG
jgi:hypothetical protein